MLAIALTPWFVATTGAQSGGVPANALRDRAGNPVLDRDGNYILTR
jgi:hypothetical protein